MLDPTKLVLIARAVACCLPWLVGEDGIGSAFLPTKNRDQVNKVSTTVHSTHFAVWTLKDLIEVRTSHMVHFSNSLSHWQTTSDIPAKD